MNDLILINRKYAPAVNAAYADLMERRAQHNARCGFGHVTDEDRRRALAEAQDWVYAEVAAQDGVSHRNWCQAHARKFLEAAR